MKHQSKDDIGQALEGKRALVTGGASGIGSAVVTRLAREGASVAVLDSSEVAVDPLSSDLGVSGWTCDVSNAKAVNSTIERIQDAQGSIDILVNNAGIWCHTPVLDVPEEQWDQVFAVNVKGILFCCQAVAPLMRARASGKIVNVASMAGLGGSANWSAYCASKAAAIALTLALAEELRVSGVQVNAVCPGATQTSLLEYIKAEEPGSEFEWVHTAEEVADAVAALILPFDQTTTASVVAMKPVSSVFGLTLT